MTNEKQNKQSILLHILLDLEWHCTICVNKQVGSGQLAKICQYIRHDGYDMEKGTGIRYGVNLPCEVCEKSTFHVRLTNKEPINATKLRAEIPKSVGKRIEVIFNCKDAFLDIQYKPTQLEKDHRVPHIRRTSNEEEIKETISDKEIVDKFMLLTPANNLAKSRQCENCVFSGKRGSLFGIKKYYEGNEDYDPKIGCNGCPLAYPEKWRDYINNSELHRK